MSEEKKIYKTFKERYADPEYKMKFNKKYNNIIKCECGTLLKQLNLKRHLKSKRHENLIKYNTELNKNILC